VGRHKSKLIQEGYVVVNGMVMRDTKENRKQAREIILNN
jgi:16S rRNA U516 pseudouridylate synthase RsuA-like enzyme